MRLSLLYYGIIDLVKKGTCATISTLKDELEGLNKYMKVFLDIEYNNSKAVNKYAKQLLKVIPNLNILLKEEKEKGS